MKELMINTILAVIHTLCLIGIIMITNRELRVTKEQNKLLWEQNKLLIKERRVLLKLLSPILEEDNDDCFYQD